MHIGGHKTEQDKTQNSKYVELRIIIVSNTDKWQNKFFGFPCRLHSIEIDK